MHTSRRYLDTGSALTLEQIQADVAILQQLNANYVRGAHYPQDQRFLDICDEVGRYHVDVIDDVPVLEARSALYDQLTVFVISFLSLIFVCIQIGIVIWEEALGPDVQLSNLLNPYYMKYQIIAVNEMLDASINHPCIVFQVRIVMCSRCHV